VNNCVWAEFAYYMARGGILQPCPGGFFIQNEIVSELGDYNAFFAHTYQDLMEVNHFCEPIAKEIDPENTYKIHVIDGSTVPDHVDATKNTHWISEGGFDFANLRLHRKQPSPEVYWDWYERQARAYPDFEESWWAQEKISHALFIRNFRPVWYQLEYETIARLYRLDTPFYSRLFSIVVEPTYRGRGHGTEIIQCEVAAEDKPVHIRASTQLENFYAKAGFKPAHTMGEISF